MLEAATNHRDQEGVSPAVLRSQFRGAGAQHAISPRLAPALTLAGGILVALGGVGTWVRATLLPTGATTSEEVAELAGRSEPGGWILLVMGILTLAAAFAWAAGSAKVRALAPSLSIVTMIIVTVRLALIDERTADMVFEAVHRTDIEAFHAGFGWGAWLLLAGVVLLGLALLAGGLRELDLRRSH